MNSQESTGILMFSGGRDSTLAALRLSNIWRHIKLLTITTEHLVGLDDVKKRLVELRQHLPADTEWLHALLPQTLGLQKSSDIKTCLSCQQTYIVSAVKIAESYQTKHIALGYSGYQSNWPEQTPYAGDRLTQLLKAAGIEVVYPVIDIARKEDAIAELASYNLTEQALEQKCMRRQSSLILEGDVLYREVDAWSEDLAQTLNHRTKLWINVALNSILCK
jgi:hypothetical protein